MTALMEPGDACIHMYSQWTDLRVQLEQGSDLHRCKVDPYNLEIVQTQHQVAVWNCQ